MIPWELLGKARAPEGGELTLHARGGDYVIRVNGRELMSSRAHGSEEEMARLAAQALAGSAAPRVLIGGLGMGYTLRAALDAFPAAAEVVVAEIVPAVVEWNRGPLAHLAGAPLGDPRVHVETADVGAVLRRSSARWDAVLLDVDNGPAALTRKANGSLYGEGGLALVRRCLRPGGLLAVWSAGPDEPFLRRLRRTGYDARAVLVPARLAAGGPDHTIFLGTLLAAPPPRPRR